MAHQLSQAGAVEQSGQAAPLDDNALVVFAHDGQSVCCAGLGGAILNLWCCQQYYLMVWSLKLYQKCDFLKYIFICSLCMSQLKKSALDKSQLT